VGGCSFDFWGLIPLCLFGVGLVGLGSESSFLRPKIFFLRYIVSVLRIWTA
jgi:hypothetical protein